MHAAGRPLNGMDQSAGRSVTAIRPENSVIELLTSAVLAGFQFQFRKSDKTIPDISQFLTNILVGFRPLPQLTGVVVADQDDLISSPTSHESRGICLERDVVNVATTTLVAFAKQESEYCTLRIRGPFKKLCTAIQAPRTDDFSFRHVHRFEVLTHSKKGEKNWMVIHSERPFPQRQARADSVTRALSCLNGSSVFVSDVNCLIHGKIGRVLFQERRFRKASEKGTLHERGNTNQISRVNIRRWFDVVIRPWTTLVRSRPNVWGVDRATPQAAELLCRVSFRAVRGFGVEDEFPCTI